MGTLFQQNGKWYLNYRSRGQRFRKMVGRCKRKALEALKKIEADIVNEKFDIQPRQKMSFRQLATFWLDHHSKLNNARSQYEKNVERINNHLMPFFGDREISHITPRMLDEYKKSRFDVIGHATINRTLAILRKMFNDAIRWGFLTSNPMRFISQLREEQRGFDCYSQAETRLFLQNCQPDFYAIACCAVYTGMRIGEIVALQWKDVDFAKRLVRVERSGSGATKSGKVRYVPINSRLMEVLKALKAKATGDLVFPDGKGGMRSIEFRQEMKQAAEKAGVRRIRMHDLRHTFASNFILSGGNLLSLQKILGHSTINMTLRYAHLAPDFMAREIELLDFDRERSLFGPRQEAVH